MIHVVIELNLKCMAEWNGYNLFEELKKFLHDRDMWRNHMKSIVITVL